MVEATTRRPVHARTTTAATTTERPTMSDAATGTNPALEVGNRLVELCRANEGKQAIKELYADDAVAVEPMAHPEHGRERRGKDALLAAADEWYATFEVHDSTTSDPYPNGDGDAFIVFMSVDVTGKPGTPMDGQRIKMSEACHYQVKDGRIVRSEFFYPPFPGC